MDGKDTLEFPPSVAYGNVYIAQQKGLFIAMRGKTGKRVFKTKRFRRCAASSPTVAKGVIYQAYMDFAPCPQGASKPTGFVTAMSARTGREKWRFRGQPFESSPLLVKGIVYVGSWDGRVYAIRARTGRKVWSYDTGSRVNTSAAYSKGRIFIANNGGSVYSLNARTGKLAWKGSQATEFFYAAPAVAYGRVFIGSTDGTMYAYGQRSGRLLWAKRLGSYVYSSAAIFDKKVYAGTYDGKFFALDAATGDVRWKRGMPSAVHAAPVVMNGLVYAATCATCGSAAARSVKTGKDSTTAFNAFNGRKVWFTAAGKYASPIVADRKRVYLTGRSFIYALEQSGSRTKGAKRERRAARKAGRRARRVQRRWVRASPMPASARAGGRRDAEVLADLSGEAHADLTVARNRARALGVDAPEAVIRALAQGLPGHADGAPGRASSSGQLQGQRLAVGRRIWERVLAKAKLQDAMQGIDDARACLIAGPALAVGARNLRYGSGDPAVAGIVIDDRQFNGLAHAPNGSSAGIMRVRPLWQGVTLEQRRRIASSWRSSGSCSRTPRSGSSCKCDDSDGGCRSHSSCARSTVAAPRSRAALATGSPPALPLPRPHQRRDGRPHHRPQAGSSC
ncbi:MAG: PQQ-binding-like beta-propeller repeat protein [Thermoleophilaceae bacterium]